MNGAHDKYKKARKIAKEFSRSLRIRRIVDRHEESADKFPDDKFDFAHWTRKPCVTFAEVEELLRPAKLVGRKIWDVHCGAILVPDQQTVLSDADRWRDEFHDFRKGACREYVKLPNSLRIKRTVITGICVMEFEDGGSLEISSSCECELEMSVGHIPHRVYENFTSSIDSREFLMPARHAVSSVEIEPREDHPEEVGAVVLWLANGSGLRISPDHDWVEIGLIDRSRASKTVSWAAVKHCFQNEADLHYDPRLDFYSATGSIYFGLRGSIAVCAASDGRDLYIRCKGCAGIHIGGDEARVLSMALGMAVTRVFDSDDSSIDLTAEEWKGVVATGCKLMESKRAVKDGDVMFPMVSLFRRAFWGEDPKTVAGHMRRFFKELSAWTHRALVKGQRVTISGL